MNGGHQIAPKLPNTRDGGPSWTQVMAAGIFITRAQLIWPSCAEGKDINMGDNARKKGKKGNYLF